MCGATPVFVDVCADTFNIDTTKFLEGMLVPRVVIPVDLFGLLLTMRTLQKLQISTVC